MSHRESHTGPECGVLGTPHNVMVIHVHNRLANNQWPSKLRNFWVWLVEKIKEHDVRVLMGDFNMSLFRQQWTLEPGTLGRRLQEPP